MQAELRDEMRGRERGDDAGAIVLRSGADGLGLDVAAHYHDFLRFLGARNFADYVGGVCIGEGMGFHFEMDFDHVSGIRQALDESGVLNGDGRGGNSGKAGTIFHRASVRRLQADWRHGSHQDRDCPQVRGA